MGEKKTVINQAILYKKKDIFLIKDQMVGKIMKMSAGLTRGLSE